MGNIVNRVFESAGPDGKVRGTPQQIIDKYQALARDAQVSGDRVAAESFLQHSEHYSRLLGEAQRHQLEQREREDAGRGGDGRQAEGGFRPQGQEQSRPQPGFGFGTLEDEESEPLGLIETPEGRSERVSRPVEPAPRWQEGEAPAFLAGPLEPYPAPMPVTDTSSVPDAVGTGTRLAEAPSAAEPSVTETASEVAAAAEESAPAAPRRGRPRRRKTEPAVSEPGGDAPEPGGEAATAAE